MVVKSMSHLVLLSSVECEWRLILGHVEWTIHHSKMRWVVCAWRMIPMHIHRECSHSSIHSHHCSHQRWSHIMIGWRERWWLHWFDVNTDMKNRMLQWIKCILDYSATTDDNQRYTLNSTDRWEMLDANKLTSNIIMSVILAVHQAHSSFNILGLILVQGLMIVASK